MHSRLVARAVLVGLLVAHAAPAAAVDVGDGKLAIHGSGSWAYARTDRNLYFADDDGDFERAMFDLAISARPSDQLVITAQFGFDPDEVELEWAFAEWRFSDAARLRLGQVQQPFGNYAELKFLGTARPFMELATTVYGPSDMAATSYFGAGLTGDLLSSGDWGLHYDAYAGAIELDVFEPFELPEPGADPYARHELLVENVVGGRLSLATPPGVVLRASGYYGSGRHEGETEEAERVVGGLSAFYRGERLWLSIEGFGLREGGSETQLTAYAELACFLTPRLQVAARYDLSRTEIEGGAGGALFRHDEGALGLNWWFSPELVLKASYHVVDGLRFVAPEEGAAAPEGRTSLVFAGAQFAF